MLAEDARETPSPTHALAILGLNPPDPVWACAGCHLYRWQGDEPPARCPNCGHIHFDNEERAA